MHKFNEQAINPLRTLWQLFYGVQNQANLDMSKLGPFSKFPLDLLIHILSTFTPQQLTKTRLVSRDFRILSNRVDVSKIVHTILSRDFTCDRGLKGSYRNFSEFNVAGAKTVFKLLTAKPQEQYLLGCRHDISIQLQEMLKDPKYKTSTPEFLMEWLMVAMIRSNQYRLTLGKQLSVPVKFSELENNIRAVVATLKSELSGGGFKRKLGLIELCDTILKVPEDELLTLATLKDLLQFRIYEHHGTIVPTAYSDLETAISHILSDGYKNATPLKSLANAIHFLAPTKSNDTEANRELQSNR